MLHRPGRDRGGRIRVAPEVPQAEATALTGFQLATVASQAGMPCVGTKTLDTNASGNMTMKAIPCADSGLETASAMLEASQVSA